MFAKLLKQEWRGSRKVIGVLCAVILISGVIIGTTALAMTKWGSLGDSDVAATLAVLLVMACVIAVALSCAASIVYVLCRFYRSRFTEEGYLTYTLPVSNHSLMLSSILMSAAEMLLVLVAAAVDQAVLEAMREQTLRELARECAEKFRVFGLTPAQGAQWLLSLEEKEET